MSDVLIGLVDAMIPGDDRFPKASEVGVHGVLAHRLPRAGPLVASVGLSP